MLRQLTKRDHSLCHPPNRHPRCAGIDRAPTSVPGSSQDHALAGLLVQTIRKPREFPRAYWGFRGRPNFAFRIFLICNRFENCQWRTFVPGAPSTFPFAFRLEWCHHGECRLGISGGVCTASLSGFVGLFYLRVSELAVT